MQEYVRIKQLIRTKLSELKELEETYRNHLDISVENDLVIHGTIYKDKLISTAKKMLKLVQRNKP